MRYGCIEIPKAARNEVIDILRPLADAGKITHAVPDNGTVCISVEVDDEADFLKIGPVSCLIELGKRIPMDISQEPTVDGYGFSYGTMTCLRPGQAPRSYGSDQWDTIRRVPLDALAKAMKKRTEELLSVVRAHMEAMPDDIESAAGR